MAGVIGLVLLGASCRVPAPSDAVLIGRFHTQQAVFESLASRARSDSTFEGATLVPFGACVYVWAGPGSLRRLAPREMREARWSVYPERLARGGIRSMRREANGDVAFFLSWEERAVRGFLYSEGTPGPLRDCLDDWGKGKTDAELFSEYRRIGRNWYVFTRPRID